MKPRRLPSFVEREFGLLQRQESGGWRMVLLSFDEPEFDGSDYSCKLRIVGLGEQGTIESRVYGIDGVQALKLAMQLAMVRVAAARAYREGRLTFLGSPDLALPVIDPLGKLIKASSWVRLSLESGATSVPKELANTTREYLATHPDNDLAEVLDALVKNGHEYLCFTSDETAQSFRNEVRAQGSSCVLEEPPSPLDGAASSCTVNS